MKKLSMNEMNVLSNEISRKINEVKYNKLILPFITIHNYFFIYLVVGGESVSRNTV